MNILKKITFWTCVVIAFCLIIFILCYVAMFGAK